MKEAETVRKGSALKKMSWRVMNKRMTVSMGVKEPLFRTKPLDEVECGEEVNKGCRTKE